MVVEGEEVRAFVALPHGGAASTTARAAKVDGTPVLEASVSIGPTAGGTLLERRMKTLRPAGRLVILADLTVGMRGSADEPVRMDMDQHMGPLYPFTLRQKLAKITENSPWYSDTAPSPWGRPVIPFEMVSVLAEYTVERAGFPVKSPAVGLFADLEIKMLDGPLFVGEDYLIRREIVALAQTKRTESYWTLTSIFNSTGTKLKAQTLLNHAKLKDSYPDYERALA